MQIVLVAAALITFQNNFWVNLHQFLHAQAALQAAGKPAEIDAALLEGYARFAKLDGLRDRGLIAINDALSQVTGDTLPATLDPAIAAALQRAAPVYREKFWPTHRAANDAWIAATRPIVDRLAPAVTNRLAYAFHTAWPTLPVLVDVTHDAGPFGAYTTNRSPTGFAGHATIASPDPANQGEMAIESVFHEASHTVDQDIMRMLADEARRQNVTLSRNLWHATIFYTVGEYVRQALGKVGDSHYMPYAYRFDVYEKGMAADRVALERDWQPWLDGRVGFDDALRALIKESNR